MKLPERSLAERLWKLGRLVNLAYPEDEREGWLGWLPRAPAYRPLRQEIDPFGVMIHTMGSGVIQRALKKGWPDNPKAPTPFELGLEYHRKKAASHFDVDTDGTAYQLLPIFRMGAHANSPHRSLLLSDRWEAVVRRQGKDLPLELWKKRWEGYASPQYLFPGMSPNFDYVGIECRPLAEPRPDGLLFTPEQHTAAAQIAASVTVLADLPWGWWLTPRSLGHEDTNPIKRWIPEKGWDPGALARKPAWDWALYRQELELALGKQYPQRPDAD